MDRNRKSWEVELDELKVALRKESVDRNTIKRTETHTLISSLSARRAWIEILFSIKK